MLAFAALFFAIFCLRMYKEFRGENLTDAANARLLEAGHENRTTGVPSPPPHSHHQNPLASTHPTPSPRSSAKSSSPCAATPASSSPSVAPLVLVILFLTRFSFHATSQGFILPAAVAYTLMGIAPLCYNSLGLEAAGIQFYFLAPVSMKDVFIAKNLMNFGLAAIEIIAVLGVLTYTGRTPSVPMTIAVILWAAFTMFLSVAVGNHRSITAPKKIDPNKMNRNQASPLSALLSIGLLLLSAGLGALIIGTAFYFDKQWIPPVGMLVLAIAGFFIYRLSLNSMDSLLAKHRDTLSETLSKA